MNDIIFFGCFVPSTKSSVSPAATRSVTFYFVKKQFDWSVTKYSDVTSLFALVNLVSIGPLVLILTKGLKVRDVTLSIIGVVSMLLQNFTRGLAYREWMYYASEYEIFR